MDSEKLITPANNVVSDEEIMKNLRSLKKLTWIGKLTAPVTLIFLIVIIVIGINYGEMPLDVFALKFLMPAVVVIGLAIGLLIWVHKRVLSLKNFMGTAVTLPVIKEIFEVKDYQAFGHIKRELVGSAGLIDRWDIIKGSDYIEGSYKGINIQYSDLHLEREEVSWNDDGNKETTYVTVFNGQWLICDFGKEFAAALRLIERKGGTKWQRKHDISKSDIETENIEFNKKFRIITGDGHSAFYLLTPHFMERLLTADEAADSSTLFCFMDGKVHIALYSGRDSFELKGVKLDSVDDVRQKFRRDLKYMTDIMDELMLNDKLFK